MTDGVGAQLADDQRSGLRGLTVVRQAPGVQPLGGQMPGETDTTTGGGEPHAEDTGGGHGWANF